MSYRFHAPEKHDANDDTEYLKQPIFRRFTKQYGAGQYLFRQGQMGSTLYIILEGSVWLVSEHGEEEHVAAVLERGQFLGEKAVMNATPHRRFFSATIKEHAVVIELRLEDLDMIRDAMPDLIIELQRQMFKVAAGRLDRSNYLVRILRSSDNVERLVQLMVYFVHTAGRKVPGGTEVVMSQESILYHIDMDPEDVSACLEKLIQENLCMRLSNSFYLIPDDRELLEYLPKLRKFVEASRRSQNNSLTEVAG